MWTSGKENRYGRGLGPYIVSGDKMYLLDDDANLFLFKLEGSSVRLISKHRITEGIEAWGPMAIAGRFLIMRDSRNMVCLNIGKKVNYEKENYSTCFPAGYFNLYRLYCI